ncbi:NAD-dependent epimerase/dehydratase family protein [Deinococcus aquiradiocola]|uniref:Epimerase n=1 Tax=Deinococcus aquiradiocola TaxID=393059 RepID=A0A917PH03_9DEIO|nr:NAD-dependent epimerase/dehydratase family protein [Deinococcus aquiradiocola]GGJ78203.1 epimerase [Deinococcus aquiradiocola]
MNILITGSAGFIGSHLVERFLNEGHTVTGVDNYISGQKRNTELFLAHPNFTFIKADVSHAIPYVGAPLDWVMHFASPASPPHYQQFPIETLMVGAQGTQNALELAHAHGAKFMLASTSEVYGDPLVHPQPETYWGNVNPIGIRSCYDEAKRYAEAITMAYHRDRGVDTRIIRIFNTYGPRMRLDDGRVMTNLINSLINKTDFKIFGDGGQTRSFQYIADLIESIFHVMNSPRIPVINLGSEHEFDILQLVNVFNSLNSHSIGFCFEEPLGDDPKVRKPDNKLRNSSIGKHNFVSLESGLKNMIQFYVK